jgi:hypothetical protein
MVRPRSRKRLLLTFASLLAIALLVIASYRVAASRSDALLAKDAEPWERVESRFVLVRSATGGWGPSWDFSYDCPKNYFGVGYVTIRFSLLGQATASNPQAALAVLQSL